MSATGAGVKVPRMGKSTAFMDEWVSRVLDVHVTLGGDGEARARFESTRPKQAPNTAMTANLLAALARAAPESAEAIPDILAGLIPRFLLALENEPNMDAQPMTQGSSVPPQDQVLTVADTLNALLRSARRWEALLDEAEEEDGTIDKMEDAERDSAQQNKYEQLVGSYNAARLASLAEEERCMQLVDALAREFRATQGTLAR